MFFCYQSSTVNDKNTLINNQMDQISNVKKHNLSPKMQQFTEGCHKLTIPNSIVRASSSLSKLSKSLQKNNQNMNQKDANKKSHQKVSKFQIPSSAQKKNSYKIQSKRSSCDIKNAIFNKLRQKNQAKPSSNFFNQFQLNNKQNNNQNSPQQILAVGNFYHKHQNIDKMIGLLKQKTQKELKQCTFNPKLNIQHKNNQSKTINTEQFYKEQLNYYKKTQDKIDKIREMIQNQKIKQATFKPIISSQTEKLTSRRSKINVYDRLYDEVKDKQENLSYLNSKRQSSERTVKIVSLHKNSIEKQEKVKKIIDNDRQEEKVYSNQKGLKTFKDIINSQESKTLSQVSSIKKLKKYQILRNKSEKNQSLPKNENSNQNRQYLNCRDLLQKKQQTNNKLIQKVTSRNNLHHDYSQHSHKDKSNQNLHLPLKKQSQPKIITSSKSQIISLQKFIKQILIVLKNLVLTQKIRLTEMLYFFETMNFIQNVQILFETNHHLQEPQQKQCLFQIWSLLEGEQRDFVLINNVIKILIALMGYHKSGIIDQAIINVKKQFAQQPEYQNYLEFFMDKTQHKLKQGVLILSEQDSKTLKKDFMCLSLIRLRLGQSKLCVKQPQYMQYSFKPSISKQSESLAQKYRDRIIQQSEKLINQKLISFQIPQDGYIDHQTLLLLDEKIKNYKLKKMREETEKERRKMQEESMIQHTSTERSINSFGQSVDKSKNHIQSNQSFSRITQNQTFIREKDQVFDNLYEQGKRSHSNKRDKSTSQIQYELYKNECTFQPQINRTPIVKQFSNINQKNYLHQNIPNFTKQIMRMQKQNKSKNIDNLNISPLLYLNVSMQGLNSVKIPVFQNDDFHSITEKVRQLMNISNGNEEKNKLKKILKEQIVPVLEKIGIRNFSKLNQC